MTKAAFGAVMRRTVLRAERTWRIPVGPGRGIRLAVDPRAPLQKYLGTSEIEVRRYIKKFTPVGARCFDVGGHDVHDALILTRRTRADVMTFEFDQACLARMEENLALNPDLAARVKVVATYLAHETVAVPKADTVDDLIESGHIFTPDFVKIDVEGAEAIVLSGAERLLRKRQPHLVVETHSPTVEERCLEILRCAGYSPIIVNKRRWLREHRESTHNRWLVAEGTAPRLAS